MIRHYTLEVILNFAAAMKLYPEVNVFKFSQHSWAYPLRWLGKFTQNFPKFSPKIFPKILSKFPQNFTKIFPNFPNFPKFPQNFPKIWKI